MTVSLTHRLALCSGHAHQEELAEILKLVKPRHFLPVHGESAFLYAHGELAQSLGCKNVSVIHNGEMLGFGDIRNGNHVSMGSSAAVRTPPCILLPLQ